MAKNPKCPYCKNEVENKEQAIKKGNRYYHPDCYELAEEVKCGYCNKNTRKSESIHHGSKYYHDNCYKEFVKNRDDRAELIDYICQLYKIDKPSGMILNQIKEYHNNLNYKYKGMLLTLKYFYETLGNTVREDDGIGIIPYMYDKAMKQYLLVRNATNSVKNLKDELVKEKIVKIKSPHLNIHRKVKHIDIENL